MGNRWSALAVVCAGTLMVIVDQTIVSVALPFIRSDLGFSESGLAWVVNGYVAPFGGLLLLAGRLGDLLGRRRMFVAGMLVFTAASLACGLAGSAEVLIGARFVQGIGGAMSSAVLLGMIIPLFPEPRDLAKAIGVFSFVQAAGGSLGSILGGVLTQAVSWPWIFLINIPIGLLTVVFAVRLLAPDRVVHTGSSSDISGAVLVTAGLILAVYTIVSQASPGFAVLSIGLLIAFLVREAKAADPLLPLRMFRSRTVSGANAVQFLLVAGMFGFLFFGAQFLQVSLGYNAMATGLALVPVAVAIGAVSLGLSARLNGRFGERPVLFAGLALTAAGLALIGRTPADASYVVDLLPAMLLMGIGFGAAMPALMALGMSAATDSDAGLASGMFNTSQQIGGALGLSVLVASTTGFQPAFLLAAGFVLLSLIVAVAVLPRRVPAAQ